MSTDVPPFSEEAREEWVMVEKEAEGVGINIKDSESHRDAAVDAAISKPMACTQDIRAEETDFLDIALPEDNREGLLDTALPEDHREGRYSPDRESCMTIGPSLLHMASAFNEDMSSDDSTVDPSVLQAGKYFMKSELVPILDAIIEKYGDIARYCTFKSPKYLASALEIVCMAVDDLRKMHFSDLRHHHLESLYIVINDAEQVKLDVEWLHLHLDELGKAVDLIPQYKSLKHNFAKNSELAKSKGLELTKLRMKCQLLEIDLASIAAENNNLSSELSNIRPKLRRYRSKFAGDGLLQIFIICLYMLS